MTPDQFHRTRLLLGDSGLALLRAAHITVVGCGAVGSFAIEALARAGIGHITLIDGDTVQFSNINRQLCALHSTVDQFKVDVLKQRLLDICPDLRVDTYPTFLTADNAASFFTNSPDFIIDAIDSLPDKVALLLYASSHHIPIVSSMGAALKTDITAIQTAPLHQTSVCPLAARLRKALKQAGGDLSVPCVFSTERPHQKTDADLGSLVSITGVFGLMLAHYVIQRITSHV